MSKYSRYSTADAESGDILPNKLNISDQNELSDTETLFLKKTYEYFLKKLNNKGLIFNLRLILEIHYYFLGALYEWAGKVRTVNISKEDVMFASAEFLDENLKKFDQMISEELKHTPASKEDFARTLSIIHNEFNIIHPFREGNGRTIRLFVDLLAVSQGYHLVDYEYSGKEAYFKACIDGAHGDTQPMQEVIFNGLFIL